MVPAIDRIEFDMIESNKNLAAPYGGPPVQNKTLFQNCKSLCFKTNVLLSKQMFYFQNKCFSFKTNVLLSKQMFKCENKCFSFLSLS